MRFRHLQFGMLIILVVFCLVMNWLTSTRQTVQEIHDKSQVVIERSHEKCPPCELFFRKLAESGEDGKLVQEVKVQQRGEPKSGTSFMYDWATATLLRTCDYLKYLFGAEQVVVRFRDTRWKVRTKRRFFYYAYLSRNPPLNRVLRTVD